MLRKRHQRLRYDDRGEEARTSIEEQLLRMLSLLLGVTRQDELYVGVGR